MKEIESVLKELGAKVGLEIVLDENGACTLELDDGRVMLLQERADLNELDLLDLLGRSPLWHPRACQTSIRCGKVGAAARKTAEFLVQYTLAGFAVGGVLRQRKRKLGRRC